MTTPVRDPDTIEVGVVVRAIGRGWPALVASIALGVIAALAIILFAPRKYTSTGSILLRSSSSSSGTSSLLAQMSGMGGGAAGMLGVKTPMETEVELLMSRAVVGEVVDSTLLQARVKGRSPRAPRDILASLNAPGSFRRRTFKFVARGAGQFEVSGKDFSGMARVGTPFPLPVGTLTLATGDRIPEEFSLEIRDREDAIDRVVGHMGVDKGKGELASLTYTGDDSLTAAGVPNLVFDAYLRRRRGTDRGVNQKRVEFLTAKSDTMSLALAAAAQALRKQQETTGILDATTEARVGLETQSALRAKLTEIQVEQGALDQLMAQINGKRLDPRQLAAYPTFLKSPAVNTIVSQLSEIETQRTLLLEKRTESDPEVVALQKSAENLEGQLVPYARTYAAALADERRDIESAIKRSEADLSRLPRVAESSSQLMFEIEDIAKLAGGVQAQLVEAKLAAITEGGDVHVVDPAVSPKKPSFPNPPLVASAGIFGGTLFGMLAALLVGATSRWVRDPAELERTVGIPALRFDPSVPLLIANGASQTVVVAAVDPGGSVTPVVNRLAQTAASRSLSTAVFVPESATGGINASIAQLEANHDLVLVALPSLSSDAAAATLQSSRPVLLVTQGVRTDRRRVAAAVQLLRRLEVPCAGIITNAPNGLTNPLADDRILTR